MVVQTCTGGNYGATATCTLPGNLGANTTLVATGYSGASGATLGISGCGLTWTNVFSDTASPNFTWDVWTAPSVAGTSCTASQSISTSNWNFVNIAEVSGVSGLDATPVDTHGSYCQTGCTSGSLTTTTGGDLVLFVGFVAGDVLTYSTFSNGYNIYQQQFFNSGLGTTSTNATAYLLQGAAGNTSTTFNLSGPTSYPDNILIPLKFTPAPTNTSGYAWGNKMGWVNFGTQTGGLEVDTTTVSGYAWSQNFGWINLQPTVTTPPSYVQGIAGATEFGANPITQTFSSNVSASDTLIGLVQWIASAGTTSSITSVTDTLGNQYTVLTSTLALSLNNPDDGELGTEIVYATGTPAGADTVSVNLQNAVPYDLLSLTETTPSALDQTSEASGTSAFPSAGSVTNSGTNDFGAAVAIEDDGVSGSIPAGSGWTQQQATGGGGWSDGTEYEASTPQFVTGNFSNTGHSGAFWVASLATFQGSEASGGVAAHVSGQSADGSCNFCSTGLSAMTATLASNPTPGNTVMVWIGWADTGITNPTLTSVKDGNGNSYTITPNSGSIPQTSTNGKAWMAYLSPAPANADKNITAQFSSGGGGSVFMAVRADEFSISGGGHVVLDNDAEAQGSGSTVNTPTITVSGTNELLYSGAVSGPDISSVNSPWTESPVGGDSAGWDTGYILSASSNTALNYTQAGSGDWDSMGASFKIISNTAGVQNDGNGNLSGYAWGQDAGYINFNGVTIDGSGVFHGIASGTVAGSLQFDNTGGCTSCNVSTTWTAPAGASLTLSAINLSTVAGGTNPSTLTLTPDTTTNISVNATVTDNTCGEIAAGTTTILLYRSGVSSSSCMTDSGNGVSLGQNCYVATAFTASSTCAGGTINTTTTFPVEYYAQATDASSSFPNTNWIGTVIFNDFTHPTSSIDSTHATSSNVMSTVIALNIPTSSLNYGSLAPNSNTSSTNQLANVENVGNGSTTVQVDGTALASGGNSIATSSQHYATSSFTFGGTEQSLSSAATTITGIDIAPIFNFPLSGKGWQTINALPYPVLSQQTVSYNGYLYTVGGTADGVSATSTVLFAPINATGSIGAWSSTQALPVIMESFNSFAYNGHMYVLGGYAANGPNNTSTVLFAPINATGSIGAWSSTQALPFGEDSQMAAALYNGYIYALGGCALSDPACQASDTSTVLFAPINATGSIGAWSSTQALPYGINSQTAVAYDGYLYSIGGYNNEVLNDLSSVLFAPINATGSIGAWSSTQSLPYTDFSDSDVVYNGYVYNPGGWANYFNGAGASFFTSTVLFAPLNARSTYWGVSAPNGSPHGNYTGTNTFIAVFSP